ncbi:MAG: type II toxin-antitoxin system RelE/ParE family toxin [Nitrospira sp.]|nr:type II toxin-antitoxin system RelE/ParE family toxin [Nitrospira sp.]
MKPVRFAPEFSDELAEAVAWYATQGPGLPQRFLEEVEQTLEAVQTRPASFPCIRDLMPDFQIHRALLARFPYAVLFLALDEEVRVLAIAHLKREPGYWLNRLQP